jgi:polysaccharide export outer membrane protein
MTLDAPAFFGEVLYVKASSLLRRLVRYVVPVLAFWCLTPEAIAQEPTAQAAAQPTQPDQEFSIMPGDVLQVFVWKETDLTRDVTVRYDGKITLPLLGDILASGRTPSQLAVDLQNRLLRFVASPQVTVGVGQANSRRVFVVGQVARPGAYPLLGPTTFVQALALAGGFVQFAKSDKVIIVRREADGYQTLVRVDYKKIESGSDVEGQNVLLQPDDTVVVP